MRDELSNADTIMIIMIEMIIIMIRETSNADHNRRCLLRDTVHRWVSHSGCLLCRSPPVVMSMRMRVRFILEGLSLINDDNLGGACP